MALSSTALNRGNRRPSRLRDNLIVDAANKNIPGAAPSPRGPSFGTSGSGSGRAGPCRGEISLNQARAKASAKACGSSRNLRRRSSRIPDRAYRQVGGQHGRLVLLRLVVRVGSDPLLWCSWPPIAWRRPAIESAPIVLEQVLEVVVLQRRVLGPGLFHAAGNRVGAVPVLASIQPRPCASSGAPSGSRPLCYSGRRHGPCRRYGR